MKAGRSAYFNGLAAEDLAARLYEADGFEVLERRWRSLGGEIDLIVARAGLIVFVEVKARRTREVAAHSVSDAQWRRLGAAAEIYLGEMSGPPPDCRFDVVLVDAQGVASRVENARSFDV